MEQRYFIPPGDMRLPCNPSYVRDVCLHNLILPCHLVQQELQHLRKAKAELLGNMFILIKYK